MDYVSMWASDISQIHRSSLLKIKKHSCKNDGRFRDLSLRVEARALYSNRCHRPTLILGT
ncbi:hypothetical protein YC2023_043216 [Brassica napus]